MENTVTVFGGSGFIGRNVVRELAKAGYRVRVAVRRPNSALYLKPMGAVGQIELRQTNIRDEASVSAALQDADAAVNLVGILYQAGKQKFNALQAEGAERIARLATEHGLKKLVHMSAIGADPASKSMYARSKGDGEKAVRNLFPTATILRPSIVFGPEDDFFNRFAGMAQMAPVLPLFGGGKSKFQPVHVDDVADAVLVALQQDVTRGRVFELGGPAVLSFKDCMELILKFTGHRRLLLPLPMALAYMIGFFAQLVPFGAPLLTVDQVRLLGKDNIVGVSDEPDVGTFADLGIEPTSVEVILPTYLQRFSTHGQYDNYTSE